MTESKRHSENSDRAARRRELPGLLDRLEKETHPEKRRIIHAMVVQTCISESIDPPAIDAIAPQLAKEEAQGDELLQRIDALLIERPELNHHRRPELLAVSRPELSKAGVLMASRMLGVLRRHPRFVMQGAVNCPDRKVRTCWVFRKV